MKKILIIASLVLFGAALYAQDVTIPAPAPEIVSPTVPVFKGVTIAGVTIICKGGETTLKVEGDYESFEWNTGSTERMIRVKEAGQYEVKVKNKGGCTFTSSVNVEVRPCS
jgi:hypothetical protein